MAKKRMYSFAKEKHSGKGILSTILGTLSLVIFAVLAWRKQCALPVSEDWVDPRRHHGGIVGICSFNWDLRKCQGRIVGVRSMEQFVWHHFTVTFKRLAVERWREQYWKRETLSQWNDLHP